MRTEQRDFGNYEETLEETKRNQKYIRVMMAIATAGRTSEVPCGLKMGEYLNIPMPSCRIQVLVMFTP